MTKELRKAIMNRSKLRNNFLKTRNEESRNCFNCQINLCVSLFHETKIFLGDWTIELSPTTVGSLLSEKAFHKESIILNSNNETISNNEELAEIFKKHFSKLVENLDIDETLASHRASSDITDPVFNAIKKYEDHPSIKKSNIS